MKKTPLLALLLCALMALSACEAPEAPTGSPGPTGPSPDPTYTPDPAGAARPTLEPFALDEKYTRYHPEITLELRPRSDYGAIFPYVGAVTNTYDFFDSVYGFCDRNGRILCDPAYTDVRLYEHEGQRAYVFRRALKGDDGPSMYLAAADGRFVSGFDEVADGGEGAFAVRRGDAWGSVGYDGQEILPCAYRYPMFFSEGLAAVADEAGGSYWYVDRHNQIVTAPRPIPAQQINHWQMLFETDVFRVFFQSVAFREGRAAFFENDRYGFVDASGRVVIPALYLADHPWMDSFQDERCVVRGDGGSALIDRDGVVILEVPVDNFYRMSDLYMTYEEDGAQRFYDRDGRTRREVGPGLYAYYFGDGWFFLRDETGGPNSVLTRGDVTRALPGAYYAEPMEGDRFIVHYAEDEEYFQQIEDGEGRVYFQGGPGDALSWMDGRVYLYSGSARGILDIGGGAVLEPVYGEIQATGEVFLVRQGYYSGLVDASGQWIIRVSLLGSLPD